MPQGKRTFSEWIRFANSLRLRLAVRIAMADSKLAVAEAQKHLRMKKDCWKAMMKS